MKRKAGYILALTLLSPYAMAGSFQLHTVSEHISDTEYNETNPGFGYATEDYTMGVYKNSFSNTSLYAGKRFVSGQFSATVGAVTGYNDSPILPLVSGHWRVLDTRVSPLISYMPSKDGGAFLLSIDWKM